MTSTEIATASKIMIGSTLASAMYIGSEQLWPVDLPVDLHEYVEIGGIRWATMNIGANSVTDYGLYFQWGDTQGYTAAQVGSTSGKKPFGWADYKYGNGESSPGITGITKYNASDGKTVLDLEDDAARANWGGQWRMPTTAEFQALGNAVNIAWTADYQGSGIAGLVCTDKTDSSKVLFFPAVGYCLNGSMKDVGNRGFYWSNSIYTSDVQTACSLYVNSSNTKWYNNSGRHIGFPVRAVMDIPQQHDYSLDYFTIESLEDSNTIRIVKGGSASNISLSYSTDNGTTWTDLTVSASIDLKTINAGDKVIFKGTNSRLSSAYNAYWKFAPSKNFNVHGNAMSLLFGDNFINNSEFASGTTYNLCGIFYGTTTLINAKNLILPATTLTDYCYNFMFRDCTSLTTAPSLPATTLANGCYNSMFNGCTSLTATPQLPATTLTDYCYNFMFGGCTSLTTAPSLPATTLANYCYSGMFLGCTGLTSAPALPATTLATYCYNSMFNGCTSLTATPQLPATTLTESCYGSLFRNCTSLTTAPELPATTLATGCYQFMFYGCTKLTTAPELPVTTLAESCYARMFQGCTSLTTAPELPATTLTKSCYYEMLSGCTKLTTAPVLPATTLVTYCYARMFQGCTNLKYIKAMFITTPSNTYTMYWVSGIGNTGTFVKNSAATWNVWGVHGIPSGWTVLTSSS